MYCRIISLCIFGLNRGAHRGKTCQEYEEAIAIEVAATNEAISKLAKECPGCKAMVEKSGGTLRLLYVYIYLCVLVVVVTSAFMVCVEQEVNYFLCVFRLQSHEVFSMRSCILLGVWGSN